MVNLSLILGIILLTDSRCWSNKCWKTRHVKHSWIRKWSLVCRIWESKVKYYSLQTIFHGYLTTLFLIDCLYCMHKSTNLPIMLKIHFLKTVHFQALGMILWELWLTLWNCLHNPFYAACHYGLPAKDTSI